MKSQDISNRLKYLKDLKSSLSTSDNAKVSEEMTYRSKHIDSIITALKSVDNMYSVSSGIKIFEDISKNLSVKAYLSDLFFFETIKIKNSISDSILIGEVNLKTYCSANEMSSKDKESLDFMKQNFEDVVSRIRSVFQYYQIENIKIHDEFNTSNCKVWCKLLPSESFVKYTKDIKLTPHDKFFK